MQKCAISIFCIWSCTYYTTLSIKHGISTIRRIFAVTSVKGMRCLLNQNNCKQVKTGGHLTTHRLIQPHTQNLRNVHRNSSSTIGTLKKKKSFQLQMQRENHCGAYCEWHHFKRLQYLFALSYLKCCVLWCLKSIVMSLLLSISASCYVTLLLAIKHFTWIAWEGW